MVSEEMMNELRLIFVTRKESEEITDELNRKLTNDFADLAVIKFQTKLILGILSAVGVAVLGLLVNQLWG